MDNGHDPPLDACDTLDPASLTPPSLREEDSNPRPSGNEPGELPLLYPAVAKTLAGTRVLLRQS